MGVLRGALDVVSDALYYFGSRRRFRRHKQLQIVEIKIRIDCEGCERRVKESVQGMRDVTDVMVEPKKNKLTVTGYVDPGKVLRRVKRKTGKRAEIWPYVPYALVDHPYVPGVYDKKAPAGYVRNAAMAANPATAELARAGSAEARYAWAFSDDNPNSCAVM